MNMISPAPPATAPTWRIAPRREDIGAVRRMIAETGRFTAGEIDIAAELVEDRLRRGPASDYSFVFADHGDRLAGYTCYGPIAGNDLRFDLHWIAVDRSLQRAGLGGRLLERTEDAIRAAGGRRIHVEASTLATHIPTRAFYVRNGYQRVATLPDFCRRGDGKAIFVKTVG